jgi:hypothetical protein
VKQAGDVKYGDAKWDALMDELIRSSEMLASVSGKSGATQADAKTAHMAVKKACSDCHAIFRVEEEGFK